jgi:hypothetical protein
MRPCVWCARMTHSPKRVCSNCTRIERSAGTYSPNDGLKGGRWVLGPRRVLVWEVAE